MLAGITWVTSSGVVAKVLGDLGRLGNRETPVMLSVLVIEDLAMALLPAVGHRACWPGPGWSAAGGARRRGGHGGAVLVMAIRYGARSPTFISVRDPEALLLSVLGLTLFVAGVAAELKVSAAVGAFLVGIALSGPVAHHATEILTPLRDLFAAVFFVFFGLPPIPADMPPVLLPASALAVSRWRPRC